MKCPDKEQLMLYVDGELGPAESSEIKSHIAVCKDCQSEIEGFRFDVETEALLREKITSGFKKRSVSKKIMAAVMAEPKPVQNKKSSPAFPLAWFLKLLVPALAIAIALFIFFLGSSSSQAPVKYTGKAYRVSVMANNKESFVDGQLYVANDSFKISEDSLKKLDGSFMVNVVTTNKVYSINVDGKTGLTFDTETMMPVFEDCNANITMLDGDETKLKINGDIIRLTPKKPYIKKVKEEKVVVPEEIQITTEKSDLVATLSKSVEEKPIEAVKESKEEENIEVESSNISINDEETLTQEATSGISIIGTDYENEGNVVSPFSER